MSPKWIFHLINFLKNSFYMYQFFHIVKQLLFLEASIYPIYHINGSAMV